jgi:hypothetical protein
MIHAETIARIRGGEIKENSGRGEFKYDVFVNDTMYPHPL